MRLEEAYRGLKTHRLTQEEAARLLGLISEPSAATGKHTIRHRKPGHHGRLIGELGAKLPEDAKLMIVLTNQY